MGRPNAMCATIVGRSTDGHALFKKVEIRDRTTSRVETRYEVLTDAGKDPVTGKRRQVRRRFKTEKEAREALSSVRTEAAKGTFVARKTLTVAEAVDDYLAARHNLRATSLSKLTYDLDILKQFHCDLNLQSLTKAHIDQMVTQLVKGGTTTPAGRTRKPWGPKAVNKVISATARLLEDAHRQGLVPRSVAVGATRVASSHQSLDIFTPGEVKEFLSKLNDARTLSVINNRVSAGGRSVEDDPKSAMSRRTLPLPDRLVDALRDARERSTCRTRRGRRSVAIRR
ncbi:Arm DNA-binding domain-containing protein [Mycobacterium sp. NPDC051198]